MHRVDEGAERLYSREELNDLVTVDELRDLLGRLRGERVSREYAVKVANSKGFPDPLINHPRLRLWLRDEVHAWLDRHRPGWSDPPGR